VGCTGFVSVTFDATERGPARVRGFDDAGTSPHSGKETEPDGVRGQSLTHSARLLFGADV